MDITILAITGILMIAILAILTIIKLWEVIFPTQEQKQKEENTVSCEKCKCLLYKEDAYKVKVFTLYFRDEFYCKKCKPNYTKEVYLSCSDKTEISYYKEMEVTEDGEPVGYKKK